MYTCKLMFTCNEYLCMCISIIIYICMHMYAYMCIVVVYSLSCVWLFVTPWTIAHQARLSMRFPSQEWWSGLPSPSPRILCVCVCVHIFPSLDGWKVYRSTDISVAMSTFCAQILITLFSPHQRELEFILRNGWAHG